MTRHEWPPCPPVEQLLAVVVASWAPTISPWIVTELATMSKAEIVHNQDHTTIRIMCVCATQAWTQVPQTNDAHAYACATNTLSQYCGEMQHLTVRGYAAH